MSHFCWQKYLLDRAACLHEEPQTWCLSTLSPSNVLASMPPSRWCSLEGSMAMHTFWTSSTPSRLCRPSPWPWPTWRSASNEETGLGSRKRQRSLFREVWSRTVEEPAGPGAWGPEDEQTGKARRPRRGRWPFALSFGLSLFFVVFLFNQTKQYRREVFGSKDTRHLVFLWRHNWLW